MGHLTRLKIIEDEKQDLPKHALVVMKDPNVGAAVTDLLHEIGFTPWAAVDSLSALLMCAEIDFELTLADITLAGEMTAIDLAVELRRRHEDMGFMFLADPADEFPDGIHEFVVVRKPKRRTGTRYEPLWRRHH